MKIHKTTEKTLEKLKLYDQKLTEIITELSNLREINNSKPMSFIKALLSNDESVINKIRPPKLNINGIESDKINKLFLLEPKEKAFDFTEWYPNTHLIKFQWIGTSGKIGAFNAETLKIQEISYKGNKKKKYSNAECLLPNGSLFFAFYGYGIIIEPIGNTRYISFPPNVTAFEVIYVNEEIWIFGPDDDYPAKFNINKNTWKRLSINLFQHTSRLSSALFKNKILMASSYRYAVYYDIVIDSYSVFLTNMELSNSCKMFFVKGENVFLFDWKYFAYESKDDLFTWNKIAKCPIYPNKIVGYPIFYKESIYIACYGVIISFNLKEKDMKKIATFKYTPQYSHRF